MLKRDGKKKHATLKKLIKAHKIPYKLLTKVYGKYSYGHIRLVMSGVYQGDITFWDSARKVLLEWRRMEKMKVMEFEAIK